MKQANLKKLIVGICISSAIGQSHAFTMAGSYMRAYYQDWTDGLVELATFEEAAEYACQNEVIVAPMNEAPIRLKQNWNGKVARAGSEYPLGSWRDAWDGYYFNAGTAVYCSGEPVFYKGDLAAPASGMKSFAKTSLICELASNLVYGRSKA